MSTTLPKMQPPAPAVSRESRQPETEYLAHDARNWLTVLQIYCDLLRTSGAVTTGYEKWVEELSSAVDRGQVLVASLVESMERASAGNRAGRPDLEKHPQSSAGNLTLARCQGKDILSESPVLDLGSAITRRLPLLKRLAGNDIHVEIDADAMSGAFHVAMAESEFERILQNLVKNAIEAMPEGGRLRIVLRPGLRRKERGLAARGIGEALTRKSRVRAGTLRGNTKSVLLRVYDTGHGIAGERLPYIFEAGVSGKLHDGDSEHRGFGLAIVRELTERAGGTVRVHSHPGHGSCFEIELPRVETA